MKIKEILFDVLVENNKNEKLITFLYEKWAKEKPDLTYDEVVEIFKQFRQKQDGLKPHRPQVISFLYRFDGKHGYQKFDPQYLADITKYTYRQITSLLDEYKDDELVANDDEVFKMDNVPLEEKINASKNLWYGPDFAVVNEKGFRIYKIPNQSTSIKFGYYVEALNKTFQGANAPWCVTWRTDQGRTNMWGSYRNERTFYFVIDESRPTNDKFHLSALQVDTGSFSGYRVTSLKNDGDNAYTWGDIVNLYPKIGEHKNVLTTIKYNSKEELEEKSIVGQITETPGSQYEFRRVSRQLKKAYINNGGLLKYPHSWQSMDEKLRELYILTTTAENVLTKFTSQEFINEIKKVGNQYNLLDRRIKRIGFNEGVGFIYLQLLKSYKTRRTSLDNPKIKVLESKENGKCGIYHLEHNDFLRFDGVTYDMSFKFDEPDIFFDEEDKGYFVEKFYNDAGNTFYVIFEVGYENISDAHILSEKKWRELEQKMRKEGDDLSKIDKIDPEADVDIKEKTMEV